MPGSFLWSVGRGFFLTLVTLKSARIVAGVGLKSYPVLGGMSAQAFVPWGVKITQRPVTDRA